VHGEGDLVRSDGIEAHLLREELANQAVHILVRAALPGSIGMSEEEVCVEFCSDTLILSKLLAVVSRQGVNVGRKRHQQRDHGIRNRVGRLERNMGDQRIAGRTFVNRDEFLLLSGTYDQIRLPVTEAATLGHDGRPQIDGDLVGDSAASLTAAITLSSGLLAAQGAVQCATGSLVGVNARW
jgi:hypothetical protein